MSKIKHAKVKNTGLIFELLVRQVASDTMNNKNSTALRIIKRNFRKNSELAKELKLYRSLHEETFSSQRKAEMFLEAVLRTKRAINETALKREKYNLIKEIRSQYNIEDFFKSRVNNYKLHASIYKLFEFSEADDPKEYVENRFALAEYICAERKVNKETIPVLTNEDKDIRILASKIIIDRFNEKYSTLNESQKRLLREYINTVTNSVTLKQFVVKESVTLRDTINKLKTSVTSKVIRIKLNEVANLLTTMSRRNNIEDKDILTMLRYYELVDELQKVKGK
jgi:hypothetical protein